MLKHFLLLFVIKLILGQQQNKPLPSPSFGRVFENSSKERNFLTDNYVSVCMNPMAYGFIQRAGTNKYYTIADVQMNWIDAENYCQSFGAHLPVATSVIDMNFFRWFVGGKFMITSYEFNRRLKWSGYWIGAYKSMETDSWRWVDNSPFNYANWDSTWYGEGPQPHGGLQYFAFDLYDIENLKHRGWHDGGSLLQNIVLCELKCHI